MRKNPGARNGVVCRVNEFCAHGENGVSFSSMLSTGCMSVSLTSQGQIDNKSISTRLLFDGIV